MIKERDDGLRLVDCSDYLVFDDRDDALVFELRVSLEMEEPEPTVEDYNGISWEASNNSPVTIKITSDIIKHYIGGTKEILFKISPDEDKVLQCAQMLDKMVNDPDSQLTIEEIEGYLKL